MNVNVIVNKPFASLPYYKSFTNSVRESLMEIYKRNEIELKTSPEKQREELILCVINIEEKFCYTK